MGTTVNAHCPSCGEQALPASAIILRQSSRAPELSHYEFTCPRCADQVMHPAPPIIAQALTSTREVVKVHWEPVSLLERRSTYSLTPYTDDGLLDDIMALYAAPDALLERMPDTFR